MIGLLCFVLAVWASPFKSKIRLAAENAARRHQLIVLQRRLRGRVQLANSDRWFLVQLYRWFPSVLRSSRSSVPRPLCVGIGLVFVATGAGSHDHWEGGRRSRRTCAR